MSDISKYAPEKVPVLESASSGFSVSLSSQSGVTLNFNGTPFGATDFTGELCQIGTETGLVVSNTSSQVVLDETFTRVPTAYAFGINFYTDYFTQYRPNMGTPPHGKGVAHFCYICSHPFRTEDLVPFRGQWYCIPHGCYHTAVAIASNERKRAWVPSRRGEPTDIPFVVTEMP